VRSKEEKDEEDRESCERCGAREWGHMLELYQLLTGSASTMRS
jgi:hypothetical protein